MRTALILSAAVILLGASLDASAGDVYQWKDAHGVTQYSSTPPASGAFKVRTIHDNGQAGAQVDTAAEAGKPLESGNCTTARNNVVLLQSKSPLQVDSDGDGKPDKALADDDRANQLQLALASVKVNCAPPATLPAG